MSKDIRQRNKVVVNKGGNGIIVNKISPETFKKICELSKNTELYKELEGILEKGRKKLCEFDKQFKF